MKLLLIRHAQMAGDPFCRPSRPVSGCLSELGVRQAEALAARLADTPIDLAISSPYGRALQTAEIALGKRNVPITILDSLHEWLPNMALDTMPSTEAEAIRKQASECYAEETWKTDMGEGCFDVYARVVPPFLRELDKLGIHARMGGYVLEEKVRDLTLAVFAHGGSLSTLLAFLLECRPFPVGHFAFQYTGTATLEFNECRGIHYPALVVSG
jgi:broad specificity phosphatase PhoE